MFLKKGGKTIFNLTENLLIKYREKEYNSQHDRISFLLHKKLS